MDSQLCGVHSFTTLLQDGEKSYSDYLPSLNDLESQYSLPNLEEETTNKFCGALTQIERSPSGVNEQDKIEQAKELYRSNHFATFNFLHCWITLGHHHKWKEYVVESINAKTKRGSTTSNGDTLEFLDEDTSPSIDVNLERLIGKKATKKRKRQESTSSDVIDLVLQISEKRDKKDAKKEFIRLTKERPELDKQKEVNEIMRIDFSALSPMQQEYFRSLQLEILEKQKCTKI
ncbi:hypothetical protein G4B88_020282 [Cannabis sativa]|uniref:No apical meristem-associated C-terminal domain-containing protein n=1 Tax=Cannabis sativa TaxID=3483 RepID=A0A7J6GWF4_CANSA|nr:hypothetical protein G4B88_020282 [Cannabis sativa]